METDYEKTGKLYKRLEAYTKGNGSQQMPYFDTWYYFGISEQFKTCKNFAAYLSNKHAGHQFKCNISGD